MKKELLLMSVVTVVTMAAALGLIRAFAPQLLGGPTDLQLVQLDERVPPFFKGVFRDEHKNSRRFLLKDPLTRVRAIPFLYNPLDNLGPHDVLGLRNATVPVAADIVTIGDSMTYGNNSFMEQNWPAYLRASMQREDVSIYNMSTGGWAAVQYLDMLDYAVAFRPYAIIVAFYTGNDPIESFQMVHGNENWRWLMDTSDISMDGLPVFSTDVPESEQWRVTFSDGVSTVFTPNLRDISNTDHPAVDAGYEIMSVVAGMIAERARELEIRLVFTIIPTKELVYADKVRDESLDAPAAYRQLVDHESARIDRLVDKLDALPGASYVDVIRPMQHAALGNAGLYTATLNGHPIAAGYQVIGDTLAAAVAESVPAPLSGLYALVSDSKYVLVLVNDEGVWFFRSEQDVEKNGWPPGDVPDIGVRRVVNLPHNGMVPGVDPARFGPAIR